jgi:transposase
LAKIGYSRDGKRNTLQVNYGLLTNRAGCPVAISVYEGNTADATTLPEQVKRLREDFGLQRLVLVGDRGMISHKAIEALRSLKGLAWITALKSAQIRSGPGRRLAVGPVR